MSDSVATVPVKSTFLSKINWTQIIALAASALAVFGIPLSADQQVTIVGSIQIIQVVVTLILKTYFGGSVTPQSLPVSGS
jgi:hypothetical protein